MRTYEESHPVGEEWVDPVFGPVRRIPKPTPWQIPRGNWFMKKEDQEAARRALGEVLRARERPDKALGADSAYLGAAEMIANRDQGHNGELVAGVDFAPPEPIASVLPRIQLTRSQTEELWALVCKGRRRNPNNDDDAAMAKEIFEPVDLTNAVQWALQFHVRHVIFLSDVPQFRRRLKTLRDDVTRFLATLPQEHDPVGYFLRRTYTGEIFLKEQLRPTDEKFVELEQAWSGKHGLAAIRNSLAGFRKNIDAASSLLSGTRPRDVAVGNFVRSLAHAWEATTGQWPKSGRDDYKRGRQSGPFADFVRAETALLPAELPSKYRSPKLDHAIRSVCARDKPHRPKAKRK
jgi:hypothetical protein